MRDALKLSNKSSIIIEGIRYKLNSFYYIENTKQVYVKLQNISTKTYLNVKVEEFVKYIK